MTALKEIYRSRFIRVILQVIFSFVLAFSLLMLIRTLLGVENPFFVVSSGSMYPTLNIGDFIVIQRATPAQLKIGDIVVFMDPHARLKAPIVHRIVNIFVDESGNYKIATVGDAVSVGLDQFSPWDASLLIGRVIMRIPYIGNLYLPLLLKESIARKEIIIIISIIIILIALMLLSGDEEKKDAQKKVLWSGARIIYILVINLLLLYLLFFSLWGWGIYSLGMLEEYRLNAEKYGSKNVFLTIGFMTYRIDCLVYGSIRQGALTFSWSQFLLLIIILFNVTEILIPYIRFRLNRRVSS
ncbi:MAG: signal peptidase I [Candidatus Bathyarchaeia archaeon]